MLIEEISRERKNIKTDRYSMSIGELISLYNEGELKLDPAFQRLYRWNQEQKVNFIESILLGIPIPEIFVAQKKNGIWSVVDGVQRISTLLQFTCNLQGYEKLTLNSTKYLPSLEGFTWDTLPSDIKRVLKRSKLGINIILTENSIQSQYELFKRLNTGGLKLEDQEIRNCLLIMVNEDFYNKINEVKEYPNFKESLPLSEEKIKAEYHMELIVVYLIAKLNSVDYEQYNISNDKFSNFLDKEIENLIESNRIDIDEELKIFKRVFDRLYTVLGKDLFKKYNYDNQKFQGAFSMLSYEVILPGAAENIEKLEQLSDDQVKELIKNLYKEEEFKRYSDRGVKAINRFRGLTQFSKEYFSR